MYKHEVKEFITQSAVIPKNTFQHYGSFYGGELQGALSINVVVDEDMTIADTTTITISLVDGDLNEYKVIYDVTASGGSLSNVKAGTKLIEFVLPSGCPESLYVKVQTTDSNASGKLNIYKKYLAR
jgi:hypothetical protein